jgi:hypothetical protein
MSGEAVLSSDGLLSACFGLDLHSPMTTTATSARPPTSARREILICLFEKAYGFAADSSGAHPIFSHVLAVDESLHIQRLSPLATISATTVTHISI